MWSPQDLCYDYFSGDSVVDEWCFDTSMGDRMDKAEVQKPPTIDRIRGRDFSGIQS